MSPNVASDRLVTSCHVTTPPQTTVEMAVEMAIEICISAGSKPTKKPNTPLEPSRKLPLITNKTFEITKHPNGSIYS